MRSLVASILLLQSVSAWGGTQTLIKGDVLQASTSGRIGTNGAPDSKAVLDLVSTTLGFLPPRMTTVQRDAIATPPEGLACHNTTTHFENFYDGTAWREAVTTVGTQTLTNKTLTGNTAANLISGTGTLTLNTSGTITVPSATDTLVGKATTDTLTNKTISFASNTFSSFLGVSNGGTGATTLTSNNVILGNGTSAVQFVAPGTSGNVLTSNGTTWSSSTPATAPTSSLEISNLGLSTSVAASALTIAVKQSDGSTNCSTGAAACKVGMRSSTATSGAYNQRSVTAALSMTVSSGSTLGHSSGVSTYFYVYLIDNAGTLELAVSTTLFDDGTIVSTTAEGGAGAADAANVMYSTTARSNVPCRKIARLLSNQVTAGTWAANMSEVSIGTFNTKRVYAVYTGNGSTSLTANTTNIDFSTKVVDTHNAWSGSVFTAPRDDIYQFQGVVFTSANVASIHSLYIGGTKKLDLNDDASVNVHVFAVSWFMNAGDTASFRSDTAETLSNSASLHWIAISGGGL